MRTDSGEALSKVKSLGWINLFAASADQIATVALPVIFVSQFGGGARATSILTIAATLPILLFSLPLGAIADRAQLRSVLFAGEFVRLLSLVGLMLAVRQDSPPLFLLAALALAGGTGTVAFQVAAPSMVARATTGPARSQLNGSIELSRSIAVTAGPPISGILISFAGGSLAFAVSVVLVGSAILAITKLPTLNVAKNSAVPMYRQLLEGFQFTIRNPWLNPILFVSLGFNLGWYTILGVVVAWASLKVGLSSFGIGVMFACYGVGMITGASFMKRWGLNLRQDVLVKLGPWCGFAFAALIGSTLFVSHPALLNLAFFLVGVGPIIWVITTVGIRQTVTPHHLIGRVSATNMTLSAGVRPLGAMLGYAMFEFGGYGAVFAVALVLFGAQALAIGRTALANGPEPVAYAEAYR